MTLSLFSFAFEFQSRHFSFSCFFLKTFEFHEFHTDFTLKKIKKSYNGAFVLDAGDAAFMHICEAAVVFFGSSAVVGVVIIYVTMK